MRIIHGEHIRLPQGEPHRLMGGCCGPHTARFSEENPGVGGGGKQISLTVWSRGLYQGTVGQASSWAIEQGYLKLSEAAPAGAGMWFSFQETLTCCWAGEGEEPALLLSAPKRKLRSDSER